MKKKQLTKKTLSVFLAVLMLMSSWVFFPGMVTFEASASATDTTYRKNTDQYGTPYWTPTDSNTRWVLWGESRDASKAHFYMQMPKTIYLDKDETLQSAGYKLVVEWSYGNSTSYRIAIAPAVWGYGAGSAIGSGGSEFLTMTKLFDGYDSNVSFHSGAGNEYGVNGYTNANQADLRQNDSFDGNSGVITLKNMGSTSNKYNNIYLIGDPIDAGSGRYSTTGINPDFILTQKWGSNWARNNDAINMEDNKPTTVSEKLYGWNEVWWDVEIYDKSTLNNAVNNANSIYNANRSYSSYVLDNGLSKMEQLANEGGALLKIREQTNATIQAKATAINNAAGTLQFQAKNAALINKVNDAKALQAKAGYNTLYTQASRQNLQAAIEKAMSNPLYSATTVYSIANYANAGKRADDEQTTINNLVNNITTAMNALERKYDIGYDNLFSFTDWAYNPAKTNRTNGTFDIDVEKGSIKITHDGSAGSTDFNTDQGTNFYKAEVKGDTEYVLTWKTEGSGRAQIHVFYATDSDWTFNANADYTQSANWFVNSGELPYSANMGAHSATFKTLPETNGLVFRFGTCNSGDSITFSDIRLVEKSVYDDYAKDYRIVRQAFELGYTDALSLVPTRAGYKFDGWYTADDKKITSVDGLTESTTVYAKWTALIKVEFKNDDGSVLKTEYVKPGTAATAPTNNPSKAPDENSEYVFAGWNRDFSNVTADLEVTATYTSQAHSGIEYKRITVPTCTTNGMITKICTACNYEWNGGVAFEDTTGEFAGKLSHTFERETPDWIVVTDKGIDDNNHTVKCKECDATTTKPHDFKIDENHPASSATCTVPGETYYKCACHREKTITGATDPDKHTYDYNVATSAGDKINHIVKCTSNENHATVTVACTDADTNCLCDICGQELIHNYVNQTKTNLASEAKCEIDAVYYLTCQCSKYDTATWTDVGSALEHSFTNYVDQGDATCDKEGTEIANCDRDCGATDSRSTGKKRDHKFDGAVKNNGDGTHSYECSYDDCDVYGDAIACSEWNATEAGCECKVCGYTKDHDWGAWTTVGGSATSEATQTRSCNVCGREENTECKYVVETHKDATCDAAEITTYKCSECNHGYTVIGEGPKGHNFTADAGVKNHDDGTHSFYCANNCGEYGFGTTKNTSVACSDWKYANTEAGKHTATCNICSYVKTEDCTGGTATCTAQPVCQFCNTAYGTTSDHVLTGTEKYLERASVATCIANETYYKYCIGCEEVFSDETYEKPGTMTAHNYTCTDEYLYKATEAKCGVNETYYAYCSNPDCKKSSEDENNTYEKLNTALEHIWVNAQYNGEETLKHTFTCERECGEKMEAGCMDSAVNFDSEPATCTSQGYDIVQCTACSHTWNINYTPALGHDYTKKLYADAYLEADANCEHAKIYWYACSRCERSAEKVTEGEVYTGVEENGEIVLNFFSGEVRKHDWKNVVADAYIATPATCTAAAKYYPSCTYADCGALDTSKTFSGGQSLGHDWVKPAEEDLAEYIATPASCTDDATYYYVCSRANDCGCTTSKGVTDATWTKENSKSGHTMEHTAAKAATCEAAGNYEYWYCDTCKKYYKDADGKDAYLGESATVIKKREHEIENVAYKAATCEEDGHPDYKRCKYDDCNYTTLPAVIPDGYKATGHNFAGTYTYDEVQLYHSKLCLNGCGKSGLVVDGAQTEYKVTYNEDDEAVIIGGEKCTFTYKAETKDGVHTHANACVCGNSTTKTYSDEETFVETVAPTCTAKGYDSYACPEEDCDATWTKNEKAANGHTSADKATSNGDGTHSVYCTVEDCGYKISTEKCSGGTATCNAKAKCEVCDGEYGKTGDHVYDTDWVYQNDAKCGVNGNEKNTCTACETEQTREKEGTALDHSVSEYVNKLPEGVTIKGFDATQLKAPTCAEEGFEVRYCTRGCGYYQTRTVAKDKNAHIWETDETSEDGLKWTYVSGDCGTGLKYRNDCTVCDHFQEKSVDGNHEWKITAYIPATCTKTGFRELTCDKCEFKEEHYYDAKLHNELGDEYADKDLAIAPEAHTYKYVGIVEATCTEAAKEVEKCVDCGDIVETAVEGSEALGHDLVYYKGSAADCRIEGTLAHWTCKECKVMFADKAATQVLTSVVIPLVPHADKDGNGKCDECNAAVHSDDSSKFCGCICHKENFIMVIIYKIVNFFWKLFKISKSCDCGAVHW